MQFMRLKLYCTEFGIRDVVMPRIPTIILLTLGMIACAVPQQPQASQTARRAPAVEASYSYSSELTYRTVTLKNGKLRYTYNAKNSRLKPGQLVVGQHPHYVQADLVTVEAQIPAAELETLASLIRSSGFLRLKPVYQDKQTRYYSITLGAALGSQRRTVEYRNGPAPKAFNTVMDSISKLVVSHFPKAPAP
jgi:hypothetical protein